MSSTFVRIGQYILDVSLSEEHKFEADVTEYPVESGGSISDNIRPKPLHVSITGIVSDTPLTSNAINQLKPLPDPYADTPMTVDAISGGSVNTSSGGTQGLINSLAAPSLAQNEVKFLRSEQAYNYLKSIFNSRDTVTIRTSLATFDNMALESLSIPRSKETTGGLTFTADFKQIARVSNKRTKTAIRNGTGKKKNGTKPTKDTGVGDTVDWNQGRYPGQYPVIAHFKVRFKPGGFNNPVDTGWYFASGPRSTGAFLAYNRDKLTEQEVIYFGMDNDRDKKEAQAQALAMIHGPGSINQGLGPTSFGQDPNPTKSGPKSDFSDQVRAKMKKPSTVSGDPEFINFGNYNDANPAPNPAPSASAIPGFRK
jgi:hypothetical protein